jgi:hypothetical protein
MNAMLTPVPPTAHGDGTEGPDAPVTPAPEPPGYPDIPALPDDAGPSDDDEGGAEPD